MSAHTRGATEGASGEEPKVAEPIAAPHVPRVSDDVRIARIEGTVDALKVIKPLTIGVTALLLTVLVAAIAFMGVQVSRLDQKIDTNAQRINEKLDAIPQRLADEFRAMRTETAAQTSAISSAITAARQFQPQIFVVPANAVREGADRYKGPPVEYKKEP
jgi:hypothetical protein